MMLLKKALGHIVSCKDASHLVSQMQERELGPISRWALRLHLAACEACTRFERQMRYLREAMHRYRD
jgi:Putative zinc-finger